MLVWAHKTKEIDCFCSQKQSSNRLQSFAIVCLQSFVCIICAKHEPRTDLHFLHFQADEDYDTGIPSPHSVSLTNSTSQHTFVVSATNDNMLEDYEESFTISISLDNPNVLVSIDTSVVPITILDDEGKFQVL